LQADDRRRVLGRFAGPDPTDVIFADQAADHLNF
jgi:hypothetical protein